jgi:dihydrofolate reductase
MWNMTTVDGFFESGPSGLEWFIVDDDLLAYIEESKREVGGYVYGRRTYEMMASYWPTAEDQFAEFMHAVPKFVASRTLSSVDWNNSRLLEGDALQAVAALKQEDGNDLFVCGSADFSKALIDAGLIDEFRIGINPLLLGSGTPLFQGDGGRVNLELTGVRQFKSGVVILTYIPAAGEGAA